jgi:hypothetical protein
MKSKGKRFITSHIKKITFTRLHTRMTVQLQNGSIMQAVEHCAYRQRGNVI